ncbi:MAG: GHKL domain-containing protein [Bernardetiaceae bacterium]|nr:GHKL domain-containing protein [Bernardetiaceae bacterium]
MNFKDFRWRLIIRLSLLLLTMLLWAWLVVQSAYIFTAIGLTALIIFQIYALIRQVERTNKEVIKLLKYIRYDDFSNSYHINLQDQSFQDLGNALNDVIQHFRTIRNNKEERHQYLQTIIQHIGIGIITYNDKGAVQIYNNAAKRLLAIPRLTLIQELNAFAPNMSETLDALHTGSSALISSFQNGEKIELSVYAIEMNLRGQAYKLITLQNIHNELAAKEMDAWQNLIKVLTHEIMNSVAPISSLAETLEEEIQDLKMRTEKNQIHAKDFEDVSMAAQTIYRRSDSLVRFVRDFRNLTQLPMPELEHIAIQELFKHLTTLLRKDMEKEAIEFEAKMPKATLFITADRAQVEQVLINLINNAQQALIIHAQSTKKISLEAKRDEKGNTLIIVKDNGPGIDSEAMDKIFIPFFTTKKHGSGIGLSLSRQIMHQHKGGISVRSSNEGSEFILKFG